MPPVYTFLNTNFVLHEIRVINPARQGFLRAKPSNAARSSLPSAPRTSSIDRLLPWALTTSPFLRMLLASALLPSF